MALWVTVTKLAGTVRSRENTGWKKDLQEQDEAEPKGGSSGDQRF